MCIVSNLTPEAAVAEWIGKNEALKELNRDTFWFTPMMETVAKRLLASATFGAKMRLCVPAPASEAAPCFSLPPQNKTEKKAAQSPHFELTQ